MSTAAVARVRAAGDAGPPPDEVDALLAQSVAGVEALRLGGAIPALLERARGGQDLRALEQLAALAADADAAMSMGKAGGHALVQRLAESGDEATVDAAGAVLEALMGSLPCFPMPAAMRLEPMPTLRLALGPGLLDVAEVCEEDPASLTELPADAQLECWVRVVRRRMSEQATTGFRLWTPALLMAQWLSQHGEGLVRGRSVIEVGAGLGLPSLVAAHPSLGAAAVTATDYNEEVVGVLRSNLALNSGSGSAGRAAVLDWTQLDGWAREYDVLIASDVVCSTECADGLVACLRQLVRPGGVAYITAPAPFTRYGVERLDALLSASFDVDKTPLEANAATRAAAARVCFDMDEEAEVNLYRVSL